MQQGALVDRLTQAWVRATGRRLEPGDAPWLEGPAGQVDRIGPGWMEAMAGDGLSLRRPGPAEAIGLLPSLALLQGPAFDPAKIHPDVAAFYERTSDWDVDAWAEWSTLFRPFGA